MKSFTLNRLHNSSVWQLFRLRDRIEMSPFYQREGEIWGVEKKQLLIDTVLNQFDLGKLYLHKFPVPAEKDGKTFEYAVIDGKQRLSALWGFIEGKYPLSSQFEYLRGDNVNAAGFTYSDLAQSYPEIKTDLDSYPLDIVTIETDEIELIEEMFSRLNESMPLNAAEKRNALPGLLPLAARDLTQHPFFTAKLPFSNTRYRHLDLAAKMLYAASKNGITDTKKAYLDRFFLDNRNAPATVVSPWSTEVSAALTHLAGIFVDKDTLLRSIGMVMLYFHLSRRATTQGVQALLTRPDFLNFESLRQQNRLVAESDLANADYDLLEFDRYTQSPNDAVAMRFRLAVMDEKLFNGSLGFDKP